MVFFGLFDEYELNYGKLDKIEKKALKYKKNNTRGNRKSIN